MNKYELKIIILTSTLNAGMFSMPSMINSDDNKSNGFMGITMPSMLQMQMPSLEILKLAIPNMSTQNTNKTEENNTN